MSEFIGPVIPKHLKKSKEQSKGDDDGGECDAIGPALPPGWAKDKGEEENQIIGPVLPPHLLRKRPSDDDSRKSSGDNKFKKMDPPENTKKVIGPTLPPSFGSKYVESSSSVEPVSVSALDDESDEDDEFTIGPLPPSGNFVEVEESRHQKSLQGLTGPKGPQREEWIASLPENSSVAKKLGFGKSMTSFASKPVTTKEITPVDQDNELVKAVDEYNKATRPEALVDIHKKKVKEKKPEEAPTRQLFDFNPEEDLKIRQLDSQQTKSIMEKAKLLNSRFSNPRGQNKFL